MSTRHLIGHFRMIWRTAQDAHQQAISAFEEDLHGGGPIRAAIESVIIPALLPLVPVVIERLRKHKAEKSENEAV